MLIAFVAIVVVAVLLTFAMTRGVAPFWRRLCMRWPWLREGFAESDSKRLRAGVLVCSAAIAGVAVWGVLYALGSPPGPIVWSFAWFGGIAVARFAAGPRAASVLSGAAMAILVLVVYQRAARLSVAAPNDICCAVVVLFALAFGVGYGLSAFTGGIARILRWLWGLTRR